MSGTITLTTGPLQISDETLTINGPGANRLTISGGGTTEIFHISKSATGSAVSISGLNPSFTTGEAYGDPLLRTSRRSSLERI